MYHIDTTKTDLGPDMDTNLVNKKVSQYDDAYYVLSNT